jgi:riboflavin synthase
MTKLVPPVTFQNIMVWVKPNPEKSGKYLVKTEPEVPVITQQDTIINYQIVDTAGFPIVFTGMTVKPKHNDQLSPAAVSMDGRLLTFSDLNTVKMTLDIRLHFDEKEQGAFSHDPQVENDPVINDPQG